MWYVLSHLDRTFQCRELLERGARTVERMSGSLQASSNYKRKLRSSTKHGNNGLSSSSSSGSVSRQGIAKRTATKTPAAVNSSESLESCMDIATNLNLDANRGFKSATTESNNGIDFRENLLKPPKITRNALPRYKRAYVKNLEKCPEVADSILCMCYEQEDRYAIAEDFLHVQDNIAWRMHDILMDWLAQVVIKMKLSEPTWWLTNNIIQRALLKIPSVKRSQYQLVGIAALSLASKVEEVRIPYPTDLVYITDKAYNCQQLLDMELKLLEAVRYELIVPTAYHFIVRYCELIHATEATRLLALYYAERYLHFREGVLCKPTTLAAVALYAALAQRRAEGKATCSDRKLAQMGHFYYALADTMDLAKTMLAEVHDLTDETRRVAVEAIAAAESGLPPSHDRLGVLDVMVPTSSELWGIPLSLTKATHIPEGVYPYLHMLVRDRAEQGLPEGTRLRDVRKCFEDFSTAVRDDVTAEGVDAGVQALLREIPPMEVDELRRRAAEVLQVLRAHPEGQASVRMKYSYYVKFEVTKLSLPDVERGVGFLPPLPRSDVQAATQGAGGASVGEGNSAETTAGNASKRRRVGPTTGVEVLGEGLRRSRRTCVVQQREPEQEA